MTGAPRRRNRVLLTAAAVAVVGACGTEAPPPQGGARVLPADDVPLAVEVRELYRTEGAAASGWAAFRDLRDVELGPGGVLHLLDRGTHHVLRVTPDGELLDRVGREGDGPGELSSPTSLAVGDDGTLAVWDQGRRSVAIFDSAGTYVANREIDATRGRVTRFALLGESVVGLPSLGWSGRVGVDAVTPYVPAEGGRLLDPPGRPLVRAPLDGGDAEVLHWSWIAPVEGRDGFPLPSALPVEVHWATLPGGRVAVVDSVDYRVRLVGPGGPETWMRQVPPRRPTRQERARAVEEATAGGSEGTVATGAAAVGGVAEGAGATRDPELVFPPLLQVVRGVRSDPAGRLWIERAGDDVHVPGPIDVLTATGEYLGSIAEGEMALPDAFGPDGLAVWIERDELDAEYLVVGRLTIRREAAGGASVP